MTVNSKDAFAIINAEGVEGEASWFRGRDDNFVRWNAVPGRLEATSGYTGFVPLFWYADQNQVFVSTSIHTLVERIKPNLDREALALFTRLGFYVGNQTAFEGISILGPDQTLLWDNGKVTLSGEPAMPAPFEGSYQDALHLYDETFRKAVERSCSGLSENVAISLTGGRDSRHIAIEMHRLGYRPKFAITTQLFPARPDLDWPVARKLCELYGWDHKVVSASLDWRSNDEWQAKVSHYAAHEHGWTRGLFEALDEFGVEGCFDGVGGDVLSAGLYLYADTPEKVLNKWADNGIGVLARDRYQGWMGSKEAAVATIDPLFKDSRDFHFWHRARRSTSLLAYRFGNFIGITPYLDREMTDFLFSLPLSFVEDGQFHNRAIEIAAPGLSEQIPYAEEGSAAPKMPFLPPRRYAFNLLLQNRQFNSQYLKGIARGWPSIAGYNPRSLTYMDVIGATP